MSGENWDTVRRTGRVAAETEALKRFPHDWEELERSCFVEGSMWGMENFIAAIEMRAGLPRAR